MLRKVISIIKKASKIMLDDNFKVQEKDGASNLVTTNDIKVQEYLKDRLTKLLKGSYFFGEEKDEHAIHDGYTWIVDPIDGTTNYSRNIPVTCISVALYNKEIILGVVYNPYTKEMFYASKEKGSYLNGKRLNVSNRKLKECLLYTAFSAYDKTKSPICFEIANELMQEVNDIRRTGSAAYEICNIALKKGDLFFEYKLSPWDYAACSIILKEANGIISDAYGNPLQFIKPSSIVVGNNKDNYNKLIDTIKKHYR